MPIPILPDAKYVVWPSTPIWASIVDVSLPLKNLTVFAPVVLTDLKNPTVDEEAGGDIGLNKICNPIFPYLFISKLPPPLSPISEYAAYVAFELENLIFGELSYISNFFCGVVVPIPTFPLFNITNFDTEFILQSNAFALVINAWSPDPPTLLRDNDALEYVLLCNSIWTPLALTVNLEDGFITPIPKFPPFIWLFPFEYNAIASALAAFLKTKLVSTDVLYIKTVPPAGTKFRFPPDVCISWLLLEGDILIYLARVVS